MISLLFLLLPLVVATSYTTVTCGSTVRLANKGSGYRLHSHEVSYGQSGSGQQSVTAINDVANAESLFTIVGSTGSPCSVGQPIANGAIVRLWHSGTGKWVHSHLHRSPISGNQEVSAYEGSDSGDNWKVEVSSGAAHWMRDGYVRLVHVDTGKYLETHTQYQYGNPIRGHLEVYGGPFKSDRNLWKAQEGMYFRSNEAD